MTHQSRADADHGNAAFRQYLGREGIQKYFLWENYRKHLTKAFVKLHLRRNAARARRKLKQNQKRGLFVDCGSNLGQGFDFFRQYYTREYFDFELFEPNPYCFESLVKKVSGLRDHNVVLHNKAVSTSDETLRLYGLAEDEGGKFSQGGSVLKEHNTVFYDASEKDAVEVEAVSFGSYLAEKIGKYDHIVIKMDIEGAEYAVMESMLQHGLFDRIDTIYVEFHSKYMTKRLEAEYRLKEQRLLRAISRTRCTAVTWI